jgi:hypothetical protein
LQEYRFVRYIRVGDCIYVEGGRDPAKVVEIMNDRHTRHIFWVKYIEGDTIKGDSVLDYGDVVELATG